MLKKLQIHAMQWAKLFILDQPYEDAKFFFFFLILLQECDHHIPSWNHGSCTEPEINWYQFQKLLHHSDLKRHQPVSGFVLKNKRSNYYKST